MSENVTTPEQNLALLNRSLYEGYLLKVNSHKQYDIESKKEGFDVNQFKKQYEDDINKWYSPVAQFIFDNYERHLYFHFIQPKDTALDFMHPIGRLSHALEKHLYTLEEVIIRIEERNNLDTRREIAEKEYGADILYKITFNWHKREIKLNNLLLARPNSDSKNLNFFENVFGRPNEPLTVKSIEEATGLSMADNIQDILRDLGFKGNIRTLFFPIATKYKVMFVNPITKQYAIKHDLPVINLHDNEK